ncbi:TetR/AcrR family transcriptional regulator [Paenibacillus sp. Marseille-Q4541]|uniref:TetR/AcrR family transcriptional regulator n=1 Tax=Paenibacillus sp. Marseille-Q4541 TaxID=2831522 RepID=UPI001BAA26D2|nr:TetR/AcrR family transcriptional regulator [Paenibacillus sp. Marseille-Q4541]
MVRSQAKRSEETKQAILAAAATLFSERGYETVTMREIAKTAGCSHTTIYIYFKDKEALLHELSIPPLSELQVTMKNVLNNQAILPKEKVIQLSSLFITFCLQHRNMFTLFFGANAERVDIEQSAIPLTELRNDLFRILQKAIQQNFSLHEEDERVLAFTRIYYYMLHGIIGTYVHSKESMEELHRRLEATFNVAFETLLLGFAEKLREGTNES